MFKQRALLYPRELFIFKESSYTPQSYLPQLYFLLFSLTKINLTFSYFQQNIPDYISLGSYILFFPKVKWLYSSCISLRLELLFLFIFCRIHFKQDVTLSWRVLQSPLISFFFVLCNLYLTFAVKCSIFCFKFSNIPNSKLNTKNMVYLSSYKSLTSSLL